MRLLAILATMAAISACTTTETAQAPAQPPTFTQAGATSAGTASPPAAAPRWFSRGQQKYRAEGWAGMVLADPLTAELAATVPGDMPLYCPSYADLAASERAQVWLDVLTALTQFESGYEPDKSYIEPFNDSAGRPVVSRGLLQISQESANGYSCGIDDAEKLHDPQTNLHCGLRIAVRWVKRDGVVAGGQSGRWLGMARYWSPFRNEKLDQMRSVVAGTALCRG